MRYPTNYGFIPHTLSPDGDPLDVLVVARSPFIPGCVVRVRPIAVLFLEDEAGGDENCSPCRWTPPFPITSGWRKPTTCRRSLSSRSSISSPTIRIWSRRNGSRVGIWGGKDEACRVIQDSIERAKAAKDG
jgi:inorganic pyrophosphatase